ncbi:MAG: hypothetical protein E4H03_01745 [Myxococcales bacterium]|nr:MAG: hypothetical protein E4H03_01745 [Myxococcales bacterium]
MEWHRVAPRRPTALLLAALMSTAACETVSEPAARYTCPDCNVVLISMDTLRADHVSAYGYERSTTPNIDALAERGVLFENAMSQSSWTRPAHLSMMTGLYPVEHGVRALINRQRLADSIPTLAAEMKRAGYATAAFTGGVNLAAAYGFDIGFDVYRTNGKYFRDNLEDVRFWLGEHAEERFFLFVHGYDPHTPYLTDPVDRIALELPERPPRRGLRPTCKRNGRRAGRAKPFVDEYDGAIHRGDRYVGKLVDELDQHGLLDRTVLLFTSDHGEEFLEHGRCFHLTTLYREVLHVPLIIVAPGLEASRVERLVPASVAVGPTLLEIAGVEDHALAGPSLFDPPGPEGPVVVSETERRRQTAQGLGHLRTLRTDGETLLHRVTDGRYERFDIVTDPGEHDPQSEGGRLELLVATLERWLDAHPPRVIGETAPVDPALEEQLKSLGYAD